MAELSAVVYAGDHIGLWADTRPIQGSVQHTLLQPVGVRYVADTACCRGKCRYLHWISLALFSGGTAGWSNMAEHRGCRKAFTGPCRLSTSRRSPITPPSRNGPCADLSQITKASPPQTRSTKYYAFEYWRRSGVRVVGQLVERGVLLKLGGQIKVLCASDHSLTTTERRTMGWRLNQSYFPAGNVRRYNT